MLKERPRYGVENQDSEQEEMRKKNLEKFKELATYHNDLPTKKLEPEDFDYNCYKCRNNFWAVISMRIQELLTHNIIVNLNVIKRCQDFVDYSLKNAGKTRFTTEDEIEYINEIINLVIEQLEKPEDQKED